MPCYLGEAATLSHESRDHPFAVERVVIASRDCGHGSNNTKEAIGLTKFASKKPTRPCSSRPTQQAHAAGQVAHYKLVAEGAQIPIMLYNVPGRTGTKISPETIAELRRVPFIESVKEACGSVDQVSQILHLCDINVMSGDDSLTLPMMAVGATGVVSVAANVAPRLVSDLCRAANAGDFAKARELHYKLLPLATVLFVETNPLPVKAALAKMGMIKNILRLPLVSMTDQSAARLDPVLQELGLIQRDQATT